jgi:hypothetical protein
LVPTVPLPVLLVPVLLPLGGIVEDAGVAASVGAAVLPVGVPPGLSAGVVGLAGVVGVVGVVGVALGLLSVPVPTLGFVLPGVTADPPAGAVTCG